MPNLRLYELAGADPAVRFSPYCWKARMALAHKGLKADRIGWRFTDKAALAFSGQDRVPVLTNGGETVADSWCIALHLERSFPHARSLFGSEAAVPLALFINSWVDATLIPCLLPVILLDIYGQLAPGDREYFRTSREMRFRQTLEAFAAGAPERLTAFRQALTPLRSTLKRQTFLAGDRPAYADYCAFGAFMWARAVSAVDLLESGDPVKAWQDSLLDAFDGMARSAPRAVLQV